MGNDNKDTKLTQMLCKCFVNFEVFFCFRVDIADNSKKKLLNGFIESVKSLELAADASREEKDKEFRKMKSTAFLSVCHIMHVRISDECKSMNMPENSYTHNIRP